MSWKESNILAQILGHLFLPTAPDTLQQDWKGPMLPPTCFPEDSACPISVLKGRKGLQAQERAQVPAVCAHTHTNTRKSQQEREALARGLGRVSDTGALAREQDQLGQGLSRKNTVAGFRPAAPESRCRP